MKRIALEETSYWPGYVDALVNVVLNILFLVGLMAVGLVTINLEALANLKGAQKAQKLEEISEDQMILAALGTLIAALPPQDKPKAQPAPTPGAESPVKPTVQVSVPRKAEPVPEPAAPMPSVFRVGTPFALAPLQHEQAYLQSKAQWPSASSPSVSVYEFDALQYQLSSAQIQVLKQKHAAVESDASWALWVTVPEAQERSARDAFTRMSNVRQQLIAMGVNPDAIRMRTISQERINFSNGRRVFLLAQNRATLPAS